MKLASADRAVQKNASSRRWPLGSRTKTHRTGASRKAAYQRARRVSTWVVTVRHRSRPRWFASGGAAGPCARGSGASLGNGGPERRAEAQTVGHLDIARQVHPQRPPGVDAVDLQIDLAQQPERVKAPFGMYLDQVAQPTAPAAAA